MISYQLNKNQLQSHSLSIAISKYLLHLIELFKKILIIESLNVVFSDFYTYLKAEYIVIKSWIQKVSLFFVELSIFSEWKIQSIIFYHQSISDADKKALIFPNKVSFKIFVDNLKNNCISIEIHSYFVYFFIHSTKVSFSSAEGKEKKILIWNSLESIIFYEFHSYKILDPYSASKLFA